MYYCENQGIIDLNRNGNSANFFPYVCNGKKIKELFASTLNRITASVRCVFYYLRRTWTKQTVRNEEARQECRVLLVKTHWRLLTFIAVLNVHAKTSLLYIFHRPMQANRNINLWLKKAPIYRFSRSKAPKHTTNLPLQKYEKNQQTIFYCSTRASTLVPAIILLIQVPLQKFPFLFIIIIPCNN